MRKLFPTVAALAALLAGSGIAAAQAPAAASDGVCPAASVDPVVHARYESLSGALKGAGVKTNADDDANICSAASAWNDLVKLHLVLDDVERPEIARAVAERCTDLNRYDFVCWTKLSVTRLLLNQTAEARDAAHSALKAAKTKDARAAAWLTLASVEDYDHNAGAYAEAMRSAFREQPELKDALADSRNQTIQKFWPQAVSSGTSDSYVSEHPSRQNRIAIIYKILKVAK